MLNDPLHGTLVLVHPDLTDDPAGMQNHAGRIVQLDLEADDIYVDFGGGKPALYAANALLALKTPEAIFNILEASDKNMTDPGFKDSYSVAILLHHGFSSAPRAAMKLAMNSDAVRETCMETLREMLDRDQNREVGR